MHDSYGLDGQQVISFINFLMKILFKNLKTFFRCFLKTEFFSRKKIPKMSLEICQQNTFNVVFRLKIRKQKNNNSILPSSSHVSMIYLYRLFSANKVYCKFEYNQNQILNHQSRDLIEYKVLRRLLPDHNASRHGTTDR